VRDQTFAEGLSRLVDERINQRIRDRTDQRLAGIPDHVLVLELIARGWAVYKPQPAEVAE
jgi:hypothetical protein